MSCEVDWGLSPASEPKWTSNLQEFLFTKTHRMAREMRSITQNRPEKPKTITSSRPVEAARTEE